MFTKIRPETMILVVTILQIIGSMALKGPELVRLLTEDAEKALKVMYDQYYSYLCYSVYNVFPDRQVAEDIVQEVFFEIWKKRDSINISTSLRSYLKRAAINKTLNHIRDRKLVMDDEEQAIQMVDTKAPIHKDLEAEELQERIDMAIAALPDKCRIIFGMSRFEELSYKEIASKLDISVKTVENQISKALKLMREALGGYIK